MTREETRAITRQRGDAGLLAHSQVHGDAPNLTMINVGETLVKLN